ncbi:hypothetical protein JR316_0007264 [Psilocybe cubensis]|uniref:Uncharacterized protein n=2 Tax=Psilocybe cubensis TaxID=181762 RepID=A0ACB8H088_PSICU|nr:hypothetical protein JR316_0007264 [Psilocybe cubensis]KAH9480664.1 hypothetical protein JR316_0007264 [Psilocybe cubensis]
MVDFSLGFVITVVQEKVKGIPEFRKIISGQNIMAFSSNLALVAQSIRTGYLLDIFAPQNPVALFSRLLEDLRSDTRTRDCFASVLHLFEPSFDQSFFVNTRLLFHRIESFNQPATCLSFQEHIGLRPVFVHLGASFEIVDPPTQIVQLLVSLLDLVSTSPTPSSHTLPSDIPMELAVALAAIFLDYPIAYVPSVSHQNALSGKPLDFYECSLTYFEGNGRREENPREITHTIMKFSSPVELWTCRPNEYMQLQPQSVIENLRNMFQKRIQNLRGVRIIAVEHCTRTLQHVAF